MAKKITPKYWFAIKASFTCPNCGNLSDETVFSGANRPEPNRIASAVSTQDMKCKHCKVRPPDKTQIALNVLPITLAKAKAAGFKPDPSLGI